MLRKSLLLLSAISVVSGTAVAQRTVPANAQEQVRKETETKGKPRTAQPQVRPTETRDISRQRSINPCALFPLTEEEIRHFEREWLGVTWN